MQNFIQIGLGVSVLRMRDLAPLVTRLLFWGGGFEKGYSRDACTDFDAQYVKRRGSAQGSAFWVAKPKSKVSTPIFPKNLHFGAPFRRDLEFFRPKTALTLDGSRVNDP